MFVVLVQIWRAPPPSADISRWHRRQALAAPDHRQAPSIFPSVPTCPPSFIALPKVIFTDDGRPLLSQGRIRGCTRSGWEPRRQDHPGQRRRVGRALPALVPLRAGRRRPRRRRLGARRERVCQKYVVFFKTPPDTHKQTKNKQEQEQERANPAAPEFPVSLVPLPSCTYVPPC